MTATLPKAIRALVLRDATVLFAELDRQFFEGKFAALKAEGKRFPLRMGQELLHPVMAVGQTITISEYSFVCYGGIWEVDGMEWHLKRAMCSALAAAYVGKKQARGTAATFAQEIMGGVKPTPQPVLSRYDEICRFVAFRMRSQEKERLKHVTEAARCKTPIERHDIEVTLSFARGQRNIAAAMDRHQRRLEIKEAYDKKHKREAKIARKIEREGIVARKVRRGIVIGGRRITGTKPKRRLEDGPIGQRSSAGIPVGEQDVVIDGKVVMRAKFQQGKMVGPAVLLDEKGRVTAKGAFALDAAGESVEHGLWLYINPETGEQFAESIFDYGSEIGTKRPCEQWKYAEGFDEISATNLAYGAV